jgi:hypothetical protein
MATSETSDLDLPELADRSALVPTNERVIQQQPATLIPVLHPALVEQLRRLRDKQGTRPHKLVVRLGKAGTHPAIIPYRPDTADRCAQAHEEVLVEILARGGGGS